MLLLGCVVDLLQAVREGGARQAICCQSGFIARNFPQSSTSLVSIPWTGFGQSLLQQE